MLAQLCCVLLIFHASTGRAQEQKLLPVDEGVNNATWPRFKSQLIDALARRDRQFVLGIVDQGIRNTSGIDGAAEFNKLWEPHSAASPLWVELPKVLFLGGVFVRRDESVVEFCAPYVHFKWPEITDATGAVIVREALLKARPATNSATLRTLSYDLVTVSDWEVADEDKNNPQKWVKLKTGADDGYLPEEHVRSPLEYRACFVNGGARWRMTGFEVGE